MYICIHVYYAILDDDSILFMIGIFGNVPGPLFVGRIGPGATNKKVLNYSLIKCIRLEDKLYEHVYNQASGKQTL